MVGESTDWQARYRAAETLLPHNWSKLVRSGATSPLWIAGGDRFWFAHTTPAGTEFRLVDPELGTNVPAFDHARVARSLERTLGRPMDPADLPFRQIDIIGADLLFTVDGQPWRCPLADCAVTQDPVGTPVREVAVSPDRTWSVELRDHNLVVRNRLSGAERQVTSDGRKDFSYGTPPDLTANQALLDHFGLATAPLVLWSPDSTRFVTHRIDQRDVERMHYVRSAPTDGGRPELRSQRYPIVGDAHVAMAELFLVDVASGAVTQVKGGPIPAAYASPIRLRQIWWDNESRRVLVVTGDRADRSVQLIEVLAQTGDVRTVLTETSDTQIQTHPLLGGRPNAWVLASGETVWWSERDGWGHLYLHGDEAGPGRQLTRGPWLVRDLITVNEQQRLAVFTAAGREDGLDPYARQLYTVHLDTGLLRRLTHDDHDHEVCASPSGQFLVDVRSWADTPAVTSLLDIQGNVVMTIDRADAQALYATGWRPPERFTVKAADGLTDLYGLLYAPHDLDPSQSYPVLDDIYPGPQTNAASVRFPGSGGPRSPAAHASSMAALGFAVMVLDARGTPLRSKGFQEHCRGEHIDANLDDHVVALGQLAASRPWLDLKRVGIYGKSGGGYASTRALLRSPEVYSVAVSACGNHDDAQYHATWGEKYVAAPGSPDYATRANPPLADQLQGKLLLIHGELDDNVTPYLTMRLVDALVREHKDFELLILPNADHSLYAHQSYWLRRRWDFLVTNLFGVRPPVYRIADPPTDAFSLQELLG